MTIVCGECVDGTASEPEYRYFCEGCRSEIIVKNSPRMSQPILCDKCLGKPIPVVDPLTPFMRRMG